MKPFLKWAGGKTSILKSIREKYPDKVRRYCEPFVGGGAVLLDILEKYNPRETLINDLNEGLIKAYKEVRDNIGELIKRLKGLQEGYIKGDREKIYYDLREEYNKTKEPALFIFLNKTCFNGLYRVNKNGKFNVPMGKYKNPKIFQEDRLRKISGLLKNVSMTSGDYKKTEGFINEDTFTYIDPPYKGTFDSYTENGFKDKEQTQLRDFVKRIKGGFVLSNSENPFIRELYKGYEIRTVYSDRKINRGGKTNELLISNL